MFVFRTIILICSLVVCVCAVKADTKRHWRYFGGMPKSFFEPVKVMKRNGYDMGFSEKWGSCLWVAYSLVPDDLVKKTGRLSNFVQDEDLYNVVPSSMSYRGSGFDRGHMAPARDMQYDFVVARQSFWMGNIVPQKPILNRYVWKNLEEKIRSLVKKNSEGVSPVERVYVMTGPIFNTEGKLRYFREKIEYEKRGKAGPIPVIKPCACWKIYKYGPTAVAVIVNQNGVPRSVSVAELSKMTGLLFFEDLPEGLRCYYNNLCRMIYPPVSKTSQKGE